MLGLYSRGEDQRGGLSGAVVHMCLPACACQMHDQCACVPLRSLAFSAGLPEAEVTELTEATDLTANNEQVQPHPQRHAWQVRVWVCLNQCMHVSIVQAIHWQTRKISRSACICSMPEHSMAY